MSKGLSAQQRQLLDLLNRRRAIQVTDVVAAGVFTTYQSAHRALSSLRKRGLVTTAPNGTSGRGGRAPATWFPL